MEQRSPKERAAVTRRLKMEGGEWTSMPPDYTNFSRSFLTQKLQEVRRAVEQETDAHAADIDAAHEKSQYYVDSCFDFYEGKKDLGKIGRAFAVPMRSERISNTKINGVMDENVDNGYASESIPFFPLLDPTRFAVTDEIRMRAMYGLPPSPLDTYSYSAVESERGAMVLVPIYADMTRDIRPNPNSAAQRMQLMKVGAKVLYEATVFIHDKLGANVVGLGAILPRKGITDYGRNLRAIEGMDKLVTTTGHGGTVYMIVETARKIMEETSTESHGKIGVIGGAGSIGWSSTVSALEMIPDHRVVSYDINEEGLYGKIGKHHKNERVTIAESIREVLQSTNIIICAVTDTINLDDNDFEGLDLTGKVIIDDSQPGAFNAAQVEARGGKLVWVVGEDASESQFITRDGLYTGGVPYNYGDNSGLYGWHSEFACGQEAAVIAQAGEYDKAITGPVEPHNVRRIGELFRAAGVRVAPFQAFGKPVEIE